MEGGGVQRREVESYKRLLATSQCALDDEIVKNQNLKREVAELKRRLKVAEDALEKCKDGMCGECRRQHTEGVCVSPNGCYEMAAVRNALDVIRDEDGEE